MIRFLIYTSLVMATSSLMAAQVLTIDLDGHSSTMTIAAGQLRFDMSKNDSDTSSRSFIVNVTKQTIISMDHTKKEYFASTMAELKRTAGQADQALSQIQKQMENLPPEQRAMVEKMMGQGNLKTAKAAGKVEIQKVGGKVKVGAWPSEKFNVTRGKTVLAELFTAKPNDVGLTQEQIKTVQDVIKMAAEIQKEMPHIFSQIPDSSGYVQALIWNPKTGFPVKTITFENGKVTSTSTLQSSIKKDVAADFFGEPKGYKKVSFPSMGALKR